MPASHRFTLALAANGVAMMIVLLIVLALNFCGADIENWLTGYVITIEQPTNIFRGYVTNPISGREVEVGCFTLSIHKNKPAVPLKYAFFVEARLSDYIPVAAYLADNHHFKSESDFETHPVGMNWQRNYCFEMPGTIADSQDIRVTGHAEHQQPYRPWKSITPVPPFKIGSITG